MLDKTRPRKNIFVVLISDAYEDLDPIYYGPQTSDSIFYNLYLSLTRGNVEKIIVAPI